MSRILLAHVRHVSLATLAVFSSTGCAASADEGDESEVEDVEDVGATESAASGTVRGKCPNNHVCAYANANWNDRDPPSAWSYQYGPEELYPAALGRKFQRRFTAGKDKVSSLINNSSIRVCLINETAGGYVRNKIYILEPGLRTPFVGKAANDKADVIEKC